LSLHDALPILNLLSLSLQLQTSRYMKKIYLTLSILCFLSFSVSGQNLGAYTDYKNYFYAFDNGPNIELESQVIKSYKVGGNAVAYVNGADNFRAYYNGETYDLLSIAPLDYVASDNLVVYYRDMILNV